MKDMLTPKILMCGLPDSGKSTYIAALSYLLEHGDADTGIHYNGPSEESQYIQDLAMKWASCEEIGRTKAHGKVDIDFNLKLAQKEFVLNLPDLDGEKWRDLWVNRRCDIEISKLSYQSTGILLFINLNKIVAPITVETVRKSLASITGGEAEDAEDEEVQSDDETEWDPNKHASTQAIIVDFLQSLSNEPMSSNKKPLAIILSAWDSSEENLKPNAVLENDLPLLAQYLNSEADYKNWVVFGVSAQGGDISNNATKEKLLSEECPENRIIVECEDHKDIDLSRPISWLINQ